jgi:hypothetical protein
MSRLPEPQASLKVWRVLLVHLPDEVLGLLPSRSHAKTEVWNRCSYVSPIFRSIFHHDGRNRGLESNSTDETPFENGASSNVYDQKFNNRFYCLLSLGPSLVTEKNKEESS